MGKWYKLGFVDGLDGICDPPWSPGHRDHENYLIGWRDAQIQLERDADREQHTSRDRDLNA